MKYTELADAHDNYPSTLGEAVHRLEDIEIPPYTLSELNQRQQEAEEEFELGGGKDGSQFFTEVNAHIMSR